MNTCGLSCYKWGLKKQNHWSGQETLFTKLLPLFTVTTNSLEWIQQSGAWASCRILNIGKNYRLCTQTQYFMIVLFKISTNTILNTTHTSILSTVNLLQCIQSIIYKSFQNSFKNSYIFVLTVTFSSRFQKPCLR